MKRAMTPILPNSEYSLPRAFASLLAAFALVLATIPAIVFASAGQALAAGGSFEVNGVHYTVTGDGTAAVGYASFDGKTFAVEAATSGTLTIPATVDNAGTTYRVTAVEPNAFGSDTASCSALAAVELPASVETIGRNAFRACDGLKTLKIPAGSSLREVGAYSFAETGLTSLDLPGSVVLLDTGCFQNCLSLETAVMEEATTAGMLTIAPSAFAVTASLSSSASLKSVRIPAHVGVVGTYAFQHQSKLADVTFTGKCRQLGGYAFAYCTALETFTVPELTNGTQQMLEYVFLGDLALETVYFNGDANVITGPYSVFDGCNNVKYCIYRGYRWDQTKSTNSHETSVEDNFRSADPAIYYTVTFYSDEAAARSHQRNAVLGSAAVRSDVPVGSIVSGMATADDAGEPLVFEGSVPALKDGSRWAMVYDEEADEGDGSVLGVNDTLPDSLSAYPVDSYDLASATVQFSGEYGSDFSYRAHAIDFGFDVYAAGNSTPLQAGSEYRYALYDSTGAQITADALVETGTYRMEAQGLSPYSGSVSAEFTISRNGSVWLDIAGATASRTGYEAATAAYPQPDASRVVLVCDDDPLSAIAGFGLAGATGSALIVVEGDELSNGVGSTMQQLRRFTALGSVYLVGPTLGKNATVKSQLATLPTMPQVSVFYDATDASDAAGAYAVYKRGAAQGWFGTDTALVISSAQAMIAAPLAEALGASIFTATADGAVPAQQASDLSAFENVLVIGLSQDAATAVKRQLAPTTTCVELGSGQDVYATSSAVADYALVNGLLGVQDAVVVSAADPAAQSRGAMLAGAFGSVLLFADEGETGNTAVKAVLAEDPWAVSRGYFVGDADGLSAAERETVSDLNNASKPLLAAHADARLAETEFGYTSRAIRPAVTVTEPGALAPSADDEDAELAFVEGRDYTVVYENAAGPGTGTAWVRGIGRYRGLIQLDYRIEATLTGTLTLSKTSFEYNGKARTPSTTLVDSYGTTLVPGRDYVLSFGSGHKNVGVHKVTATGAGGYAGKLTASFTIVPQRTTLGKLTAGKGKATVTWAKRTEQVDGYQIRYSTAKNMKGAKTKTVKKASATKTALKKLTRKKVQYVQVRTYKKVKGAVYCSAWSAAKRVKVK